MRWLGGENDREAWFKFGFKEGQLLECAVRDDAGHTQGTIVVKVLEKKATGPAGHFVDCQYLCASDSHYSWWATEGPGHSLRKKATYHFCDGNSHECQEKLGRQKLIHVETFRLLTDEVNQSKSPTWLFTRPCFAIMEPHLKGLTKPVTPGEGHGLPWVGQEEKASSDGSDSSEDEGREDMRKQISRLKKELAAAEENSQKKGDKRKRPASGDKKKKKKDKKRRSEGSPERGDEKKKAKKKKRRDDSGPGSARGKRKADRSRKRSRSRKRRRSSSADSPKRGRLFGGGKSSSEDSSSPGRKGDRGPFGAAEKERFDDRRHEDSSDEGSVFREASTQGAATNQLKLTEYSQRYPGRLAARLLLRMQRESSLSSVGATLGKKSTPAAALHYLQTMMLPTLGQKVNVRAGRELRTLCTVLDLMAQEKMPQAADIVAPRVKALERACSEGLWGAAQFLELIGGEQQGLLDRAEQYYLSKEFLLEQKLKGLERNNPRQGKGDQKGLKGRGGKGDREKGASVGKGKDKVDTTAK